MDKHCLVVKWDYHYDKESTWFDDDHGEERYLLQENTCFPVPRIEKKKVEIQTVTEQNGNISVTLYTDYQTLTVKSDGVPVQATVSYDYMAAGDSVTVSSALTFSIELI